ncbi:hypothetical protein C2E20_3963 [Micractinium conductrix]|uniref:Glycosyltransferase 61 catalytic domain-containing protein n=1 Tax=Micractinium conductrix TaxID=554055 RepID=A0A2P6VF70_9CHLO|nr:hypothetical protein C2E20_3963 [Micractinium conductrix]|eukprot:PSC72728.1 hypothetical protein C2E20_3963 [Micractinium conductrix]
MEGGASGTTPYLIEPERDYKKYIFVHRGDEAARDYRYALPSIRVRPASAAEGAPYLAEPVFSDCTLPVVLYPMWASNVAHMFRDNAAKLWGALQRTRWAAQAKLVLVTAEGHAAPRMNYQILQPMSALRVETWADFSARLPAGQASAGGGWLPAERLPGSDDPPAAPPASVEGGPRRCFRQLLVCPRGFNTSTTGWPLHSLGQHLARHYAPQLPALPPPPLPPPQRAGRAAATPGSGSERVLSVIFQRRVSADRQLLNSAELVARCNKWQSTTSAGRRVRAACQEVEMGDLLTGIAAAQAADVFVAVHGANQMNGWLMRPGGAVIELQPFGFDAGPAHLQYPLFNLEDEGTRVQWWLISQCDPRAWTPGVGEAEGTGQPSAWPKFRNIALRWEALEVALQAAANTASDMREYRRRWDAGTWWWWAGPGGAMRPVGRGRRTQLRCPANSTDERAAREGT